MLTLYSRCLGWTIMGHYGTTGSTASALLLSPQGDIAFSKEDELGTNNAWVWPFTAGIRLAL